jgi:hypothetical protein
VLLVWLVLAGAGLGLLKPFIGKLISSIPGTSPRGLRSM